jgi:hypothetical protein
MSEPRQRNDSDSDTSDGPPTPTKGTTYAHDLNSRRQIEETTYVHDPNNRRHNRIDGRKRHSKTINNEDDGSNQKDNEPIVGQVGETNLAFDCNVVKEILLYGGDKEYLCANRSLTDTPLSEYFTDRTSLSELGMEDWRFALHIIFNIPSLVSFIEAQPQGRLHEMRNGSLSPIEFDIWVGTLYETKGKTIYASCMHIRIHSSLIPPLKYLSKLVRDANEIYFRLLDTITLDSECDPPIIHKVYNGEDSFIIRMDVTANISHGKSLGCEHSPHSHILKECMSKQTYDTLPIILNVSIQRNDFEHLTLPTDVAHTKPKQKLIFEKTLTLTSDTSDNRTFTYTLVAVVVHNDGQIKRELPQTICKQQDQWVRYNNDQTTQPMSTNICQDEYIQEQVTLLVYEVNDAFNMNSSLHSIHNLHPEEEDRKQSHLLAANVLAELNRNTEKETGKPQEQNEDRPTKRRRNIIITSTMQLPMPSQAKNILFTTTKPNNNDTDSPFSLDMSVPTNQEKAAFIRSKIPSQYWKEERENNHVIFHFGDEIIPVAIHMWDEEKATRNETTDIPELMENYIQVMLIR